MQRLILKTLDADARSVELRPGLNRIGRGSMNDLFIDHASVSQVHCEVVVEGEDLTVRDLGSTNGTYVDGRKIRVSPIQLGQRLTVGNVEVSLEVAPVVVSIPEFRKVVAPPVLKKPVTGKAVCLSHEDRPAMWKCTKCARQWCAVCIHRVRRIGGQPLNLCPDCSFPCELLPEFANKQAKSWFGTLRDKVSLSLGVTRKMPRRRR